MKDAIRTYTFAAGVLALGLIAATLIAGGFFYQARALDNVIAVTGSAKQDIVSDQVKWMTSISRMTTAATLKSAYAQMDSDLVAVKQFYTDNGIDFSTIDLSPISMEEVYDQNNNPEKRYILRQTFELNSTEVEKVTALSRAVQPLIAKGVIFNNVRLEYSYSKLAELRISLLSKAVADARARATELVSGTGKTIGKLKSASSGVVQVLSVNSTDISDYGSYDTSNVKKTVMVTAKTTFTLK